MQARENALIPLKPSLSQSQSLRANLRRISISQAKHNERLPEPKTGPWKLMELQEAEGYAQRRGRARVEARVRSVLRRR